MNPSPGSCILRLAALAAALGLAACSSLYYATMESFGVEKRHILVDRVEEARDSQEEAKEQIKTTLERLKELSNFDGGDLEDMYEKLAADYEDAEDQAKDVGERIDAIEDVVADMVSEMEDEIEQISKAEYRRESEQKLRNIQDRSQKMVSAMRAAESRMEPVLQAFRDEVLRLKHSLNESAIRSLEGTVVEIEGDVSRLIADMERSIAEANSFIETMNTQ